MSVFPLDIFVFDLHQYFNIQYMLPGKKRCLWFLDIFVFGLLLTVLSYALDFANTIHFFSQVGSKVRKPTHRKTVSGEGLFRNTRTTRCWTKNIQECFKRQKYRLQTPRFCHFFHPAIRWSWSDICRNLHNCENPRKGWKQALWQRWSCRGPHHLDYLLFPSSLVCRWNLIQPSRKIYWGTSGELGESGAKKCRKDQ